jgi:hypothetical protein
MKKILATALVLALAAAALLLGWRLNSAGFLPDWGGIGLLKNDQIGKSTKVGDVVKFAGHDWRVLDVKDGKALLLSDAVLEIRIYHKADDAFIASHPNSQSLTWEESDMRAYLNGQFYDSAFSADEKELIAQTSVANDPNPKSGNGGTGTTQDKVFLLSLEEVIKYFGGYNAMLYALPGNEYYIDDGYNEARIAYAESGRAYAWWLRSPGRDWNLSTLVGSRGELWVEGTTCQSEGSVGIRPALWVDLESQ